MQFYASHKCVLPLFACIGIGVLLLSLGFLKESLYLNQVGIETEGTITTVDSYTDDEGTTMYTPSFSFEVHGEMAHGTSSLSSSNLPFMEGDTVPVLYHPDNPAGAEIKTFGRLYGPTLGAGLLGLAFFLAGGIPSIIMFRSAKRRRALKREGIPAQGTVKEVFTDHKSARLNGMYARRIVAEVADPSRGNRTLKSERFYWEVEQALQPGDAVQVLIDPNNGENYIFDIKK